MSRLDALLEASGHVTEWSDEWIRCEGCLKAVRTAPNGHSWTRSYFELDDGFSCCECIRQDPEPYLEALRGKHWQCDTLDILGSDADVKSE